MPLSPSDQKQINRKRHIGNDVVVIIFKESAGSDDQIDVTSFHTRFNHVFFVISPEMSPEGLKYRLNVCYKPGVAPAAPFLDDGVLLATNQKQKLHDWLMCKLITAERNARISTLFQASSLRTRGGMLEDVIKKLKEQSNNPSSSSSSSFFSSSSSSSSSDGKGSADKGSSSSLNWPFGTRVKK